MMQEKQKKYVIKYQKNIVLSGVMHFKPHNEAYCFCYV